MAGNSALEKLSEALESFAWRQMALEALQGKSFFDLTDPSRAKMEPPRRKENLRKLLPAERRSALIHPLSPLQMLEQKPVRGFAHGPSTYCVMGLARPGPATVG